MAAFAALQLEFFSSSGGSKRNICSSHTIYCKKHSVRREDSATPSHLTLFSVGWPPYCSGSNVEAVFSRVGCVTATHIQHSTGPVGEESGGGGGGRVVYVVFSLGEELERALEMCASGEVVRCDVGSMGLSRWCEEYASSRPTPAELDSAVRKVLGDYDESTAEQQLARKRLSQPDSEGWVTVTRRDAYLRDNQKKKKKKAKKLVNFYQFQQRESQREAVAELRRKFHKDKERVAELRARRRFRPF